MCITQVIDDVCSVHFPAGEGSSQNVDQFEERTGCVLPLDMRDFYSRINGARLFDRRWPPFFILPIEHVEPAGVKILGESPAASPFGWFAFCDVQDGNYIAVDLNTNVGTRCDIIDCFHESFPEDCKIITDSFTSFVKLALASKGKQFWLH